MLILGIILMRMVHSVSNLIKGRYFDKAVIDNLIFRAHYRLTAAIFFVFCIIVKITILLGPINCLVDESSALPKRDVNAYCWINRKFTILGLKDEIRVVPGFDQEKQVKYHAYYQWVPFILFFQGLLFYLPHWIWKNWEEGKIGQLTDGLRGPVENEERKDRQNRLVQYLFETLKTNNIYAFGYFLCEALNFIIVGVNMMMMNEFVGNTFTTYGNDVLKFIDMEQTDRKDPMIEVFPRLIKCTYYKYGPSGTIQTYDTICILTLNVLNEKIYIFLWFWLNILAVFSAVALLYSLVLLIVPPFRRMILIKKFRLNKSSNISALIKKIHIGDFLILHFLGQNVNLVNFREILEELSNKLHIDNNNISRATSTVELTSIYPHVPNKNV